MNLSQNKQKLESAPSKRISLSMFWDEFMAFVSLEKGALYTTLELTRRPGATVNGYLDGARGRLTNPVRYLIMSTALVTLAYVSLLPRDYFVEDIRRGMQLGAETSGAKPDVSNPASEEDLLQVDHLLAELESGASDRFEKIKFSRARLELQQDPAEQIAEISLTWMNVFLLTALPINTMLTWLLFRKSNKNFAEHLVVNCYTLGYQNLLAIAFAFPSTLGFWGVFSALYLIVSFVYQFVVWRQAFEVRGVFWNAAGVCVLLLSVLLYLILQGAVSALVLFYGV